MSRPASAGRRLSLGPHESPLLPVRFSQAEYLKGDRPDDPEYFDPRLLRDSEFVIESWETEGHLRAGLTLTGVRLADYEVLPQQTSQ